MLLPCVLQLHSPPLSLKDVMGKSGRIAEFAVDAVSVEKLARFPSLLPFEVDTRDSIVRSEASAVDSRVVYVALVGSSSVAPRSGGINGWDVFAISVPRKIGRAPKSDAGISALPVFLATATASFSGNSRGGSPQSQSTGRESAPAVDVSGATTESAASALTVVAAAAAAVTAAAPAVRKGTRKSTFIASKAPTVASPTATPAVKRAITASVAISAETAAVLLSPPSSDKATSSQAGEASVAALQLAAVMTVLATKQDTVGDIKLRAKAAFDILADASAYLCVIDGLTMKNLLAGVAGAAGNAKVGGIWTASPLDDASAIFSIVEQIRAGSRLALILPAPSSAPSSNGNSPDQASPGPGAAAGCQGQIMAASPLVIGGRSGLPRHPSPSSSGSSTVSSIASHPVQSWAAVAGALAAAADDDVGGRKPAGACGKSCQIPPPGQSNRKGAGGLLESAFKSPGSPGKATLLPRGLFDDAGVDSPVRAERLRFSFVGDDSATSASPGLMGSRLMAVAGPAGRAWNPAASEYVPPTPTTDTPAARDPLLSEGDLNTSGVTEAWMMAAGTAQPPAPSPAGPAAAPSNAVDASFPLLLNNGFGFNPTAPYMQRMMGSMSSMSLAGSMIAAGMHASQMDIMKQYQHMHGPVMPASGVGADAVSQGSAGTAINCADGSMIMMPAAGAQQQQSFPAPTPNGATVGHFNGAPASGKSNDQLSAANQPSVLPAMPPNSPIPSTFRPQQRPAGYGGPIPSPHMPQKHFVFTPRVNGGTIGGGIGGVDGPAVDRRRARFDSISTAASTVGHREMASPRTGMASGFNSGRPQHTVAQPPPETSLPSLLDGLQKGLEVLRAQLNAGLREATADDVAADIEEMLEDESKCITVPLDWTAPGMLDLQLCLTELAAASYSGGKGRVDGMERPLRVPAADADAIRVRMLTLGLVPLLLKAIRWLNSGVKTGQQALEDAIQTLCNIGFNHDAQTSE